MAVVKHDSPGNTSILLRNHERGKPTGFHENAPVQRYLQSAIYTFEVGENGADCERLSEYLDQGLNNQEVASDRPGSGYWENVSRICGPLSKIGSGDLRTETKFRPY